MWTEVDVAYVACGAFFLGFLIGAAIGAAMGIGEMK